MESKKLTITLTKYTFTHNLRADNCVVDRLNERILFMNDAKNDTHLVVCIDDEQLMFYPGYGVKIKYIDHYHFEIERLYHE